MDEQNTNITHEAEEVPEAQKGTTQDYPFIVEITAAILADATTIEDAERNLADPSFITDLPEIVGNIIAMIRKEIEETPQQRRETAPFYDVYQKIPGYDPALDPESEAFNADAYTAAINAFPFDEFFKQILRAWGEMVEEQKRIREIMPDFAGLAYEVQKAIRDTLSDDFIKDLQAQIDLAREKAGTLSVKRDPHIIAKQAEKLLYPLDKPNSKIWNMLSEADAHGQMMMNFKTGKTKDVLVFYSINFDELDPALKISKKLTPYDKRVYIAAAALFNAGNEVITATQIFREMGNSSQPAPEQIQKIWDSLTKMRAAVIQLDNQKETETIKKYGAFKYDGQLLPFERISAYVNNTLTDAAIHLFREPPLVSFARQRNQVTTISRKLLESPISKTEANLQLEDYLLERIGHMKKPNSTTSRKMLYSTIFENCGIISRSQKSRAPEKIKRYLEWYKKEGWILGYEMQADGVKIIL